MKNSIITTAVLVAMAIFLQVLQGTELGTIRMVHTIMQLTTPSMPVHEDSNTSIITTDLKLMSLNVIFGNYEK